MTPERIKKIICKDSPFNREKGVVSLSIWNGEDGSQVLSCALLSKATSPAIVHIHDRMPVVLRPEYFDAWLNSKTPRQVVQEIITDSHMVSINYPVNTRVNNTRNEFADLLEPFNSGSSG